MSHAHEGTSGGEPEFRNGSVGKACLEQDEAAREVSVFTPSAAFLRILAQIAYSRIVGKEPWGAGRPEWVCKNLLESHLQLA
jgi:hypothetical protein